MYKIPLDNGFTILLWCKILKCCLLSDRIAQYHSLKVEEVLLHEAARGLGLLVVVDQSSVLLGEGCKLVVVLARLLNEEIGGVLGDGHSLGRVVDGLIWDALSILAEPK